MRPLWRAIAAATQAISEESAPNVIRDLDAIEAALERAGMEQRVGAAERSKLGNKKNAG
jgi:hypothetical protein